MGCDCMVLSRPVKVICYVSSRGLAYLHQLSNPILLHLWQFSIVSHSNVKLKCLDIVLCLVDAIALVTYSCKYPNCIRLYTIKFCIHYKKKSLFPTEYFTWEVILRDYWWNIERLYPAGKFLLTDGQFFHRKYNLPTDFTHGICIHQK